MPKTWFITGASRGLGAQIVQAALRAGDRVVATGRSRDSLVSRLGADDAQRLSLELDVTDADQAQAAVARALEHFGTIDVLVNNAGYGQLGLFEECTLQDAQAQFATNLFGVFNVTWAVLPAMRAARKGHVFNVSSLGGMMGAQHMGLYSSSKFALEGFSECLWREVAPFGIFVTLVEPGSFRTEFLSGASLRFGDKPVVDYDDRRAELRASFERRDGKQAGDPARLADAIVHLCGVAQPPLRFLAGAAAVKAVEAKLVRMREEIDRWRTLSVGTDGDPQD